LRRADQAEREQRRCSEGDANLPSHPWSSFR
jgi:hypothetical protein